MPDPLIISCPECANPIPEKGRTGPRKKYCSTRCKRKANKRVALAAEMDARTKARQESRSQCQTCGCEFVPERRIDQVYCSPDCRPPSAEHSLSALCEREGCDRPRQARDLCKPHYRREARADGREKRKIWDDKGRKNYQVRLERLDGANNSDPVMLRALIRRGDRDCPECGEEIDLSLEYPHPMYRTIDHIIPLAKGGKHILSNCQLMHYQCNAAKGVRLSAKA